MRCVGIQRLPDFLNVRGPIFNDFAILVLARRLREQFFLTHYMILKDPVH